MTKDWVSNWTRLLLSLFNMQESKNKKFATKSCRSYMRKRKGNLFSQCSFLDIDKFTQYV